MERWDPPRVSWPVRSGGHEPPDMWGDSRQGTAEGLLAHAGKWAGRLTVPRYPLVPESDGLLEAHAPQQASGASELPTSLHALVGSVPIDVPVAPQSNLVFDEDSQIWRWHGGQACDVPSPRRSARDALVARVAATKSALDHHAGDVADRPASGERYHRDSTKAADGDGRTDGRPAQSAFEMARAAEDAKLRELRLARIHQDAARRAEELRAQLEPTAKLAQQIVQETTLRWSSTDTHELPPAEELRELRLVRMHQEAARREEELRAQLEQSTKLAQHIEQETTLRRCPTGPNELPPAEEEPTPEVAAAFACAPERSTDCTLPSPEPTLLQLQPAPFEPVGGGAYSGAVPRVLSPLGPWLPPTERASLERLVPSALVAHRMEALRLLEEQQEALRTEEAERWRAEAGRLQSCGATQLRPRGSAAAAETPMRDAETEGVEGVKLTPAAQRMRAGGERDAATKAKAARAHTDKALAAVEAEAARLLAEDALAARLYLTPQEPSPEARPRRGLCLHGACAFGTCASRSAPLRLWCLTDACIDVTSNRVPVTRRAQPAASVRRPLPHLHQDWAHSCQICAGTGANPSHIRTRTGLSPCHVNWDDPLRICTGTGLTPATSALGLGSKGNSMQMLHDVTATSIVGAVDGALRSAQLHRYLTDQAVLVIVGGAGRDGAVASRPHGGGARSLTGACCAPRRCAVLTAYLRACCAMQSYESLVCTQGQSDPPPFGRKPVRPTPWSAPNARTKPGEPAPAALETPAPRSLRPLSVGDARSAVSTDGKKPRKSAFMLAKARHSRPRSVDLGVKAESPDRKE